MNKRQTALFFLTLIVTIAIAGWEGHPAYAERSDTLTIAAANSIKQALRHLLPLFEAQHKTADVRVIYGPSQSLRNQIEQGAPVDVFLPSSIDEIDRLEQAGLIIKNTKRLYAQTRLVVITGNLLPANITSIQDVAKPEIRRVAIGNTKTSSVGKFATELFENLNLDKQIGVRYVYGEHSGAVLDLVARGEAEVGVVYRTDAAQSSKVRVVAEAPPGSHSPILYGLAIVWTSNNVPLARAFSEFMQSPAAQRALQEDGFDRLPSQIGLVKQ